MKIKIKVISYLMIAGLMLGAPVAMAEPFVIISNSSGDLFICSLDMHGQPINCMPWSTSEPPIEP